jgi:hypothetical protein
MVNWYYVLGSDRVGPVSEDALTVLFTQGKISSETYVWKKGFANWVRMKEVEELHHLHKVGIAPAVEVVPEENSPEVQFIFDWAKIKDSEELFFIKIGSDRRAVVDEKIYGPYSTTELKEALEEKRINNQSLVYSAGMKGWVEVGETPLNPIHLSINEEKAIEAPLMLVIENRPLPLIGLIHTIEAHSCVVLASGHLEANNNLLASLYLGSELKAKNIKVSLTSFDNLEQKFYLDFTQLDNSAAEIMQQHAS